MGTSLTPEFWRLFAVLLVTFAAITCGLTAALDALVVRWQRRRRNRPSAHGSHRAPAPPRRTPAHH